MKVLYDLGDIGSGHGGRGIGFFNDKLVPALKAECAKRNIIFSSGQRLMDTTLVHHPYFDLFHKSLTLNKNAKNVVTIYDTIPLLYPSHYPPGLRGKLNFELQKIALRNIDAIITISETSKKDIVRFLGVVPEKVHVVGSGPGNEIYSNKKEKNYPEISRRYNLPKKYILYVGDVNYNKNIVTLVKAAKLAKIPLVIIGRQAKNLVDNGYSPAIEGPRDLFRKLTNQVHPQTKHFEEFADEAKDKTNIHILGFVSTDDLVGIWQMASCYCQPSYYEGFGMPVLESFWAEVPVIAARTQALVEVAGDAAYYFDPYSVEELVDGLKRVTFDKQLASNLVEAGKKPGIYLHGRKLLRL